MNFNVVAPILLLLCGAVVLFRLVAKERFIALPEGARSTLYGGLGAVMGFVTWVGFFVVAGLTNIELWYVQNFDPASYRWIAIASLPVLAIIGALFGFRLARRDRRTYQSAQTSLESQHPLD